MAGQTTTVTFLAQVGHLELLRVGAREVLVLDAVVAEIAAKDAEGIVSRDLAEAGWSSIVPDPVEPLGPPADRLGPGESSVPALAEADDQVVLDDLAARRHARRRSSRSSAPLASWSSPGSWRSSLRPGP